MSNSVPMYALDKVKTSLAIPANVTVRLQKRADKANKTLAQYINSELAELVDEDPWTIEDEMKVRSIIDENFKKRQNLKAKKGVK